jgi:hypothetical protein
MQPLALVRSLIAEAEEDTGTWALATYMNLKTSLLSFSPAHAAYLVQSVTETMFSPICKSTTRYKLAQLLSAIHAQKLQEFERLFGEYKTRFSEHYETFSESGNLGAATVQLLEGLHAREGNRRVAGRPGLSGDIRRRRFSVCGFESSLLRASATGIVDRGELVRSG